MNQTVQFLVSWVLWLLLYINDQKMQNTCLIFFLMQFLLQYLLYINNHNTNDSKNCSVWFIHTGCCCCKLFWVIKMNIQLYETINIEMIIVRCDKCFVWITMHLVYVYFINQNIVDASHFISVLMQNVWLCAVWLISISIVYNW